MKLDNPYFESDGQLLFNNEAALAILLHEDVVSANQRRFICPSGNETQSTVVLFVNCSDTFILGCADAEPFTLEETREIYDAFNANGDLGVTRWCCLKRGERPLPRIEKHVRAAGLWNDEMEKLAR